MSFGSAFAMEDKKKEASPVAKDKIEKNEGTQSNTTPENKKTSLFARCITSCCSKNK
jgi:hypothetical protein